MPYLLFIAVLSLACFIQGIIGFGFALIATPLALIFLEKETVVVSMIIVSIFLNAYLSLRIKKSLNKKLIILLFLASLLGMPIGVWVLKNISANTMKILVGSLTILFTSLLYTTNIKLPKNNFLSVISGFFSGLLHSSTSMSGPPVVLLLAGQKLPKDEFRKTLVVFFFLIGTASLPMFFLNSLISWQNMSYGVVSVPFVLLAGFLGDKVSRKVPQNIFKILALGIIFISGLYAIITGLF